MFPRRRLPRARGDCFRQRERRRRRSCGGARGEQSLSLQVRRSLIAPALCKPSGLVIIVRNTAVTPCAAAITLPIYEPARFVCEGIKDLCGQFSSLTRRRQFGIRLQSYKLFLPFAPLPRPLPPVHINSKFP